MLNTAPLCLHQAWIGFLPTYLSRPFYPSRGHSTIVFCFEHFLRRSFVVHMYNRLYRRRVRTVRGSFEFDNRSNSNWRGDEFTAKSISKWYSPFNMQAKTIVGDKMRKFLDNFDSLKARCTGSRRHTFLS